MDRPRKQSPERSRRMPPYKNIGCPPKNLHTGCGDNHYGFCLNIAGEDYE